MEEKPLHYDGSTLIRNEAVMEAKPSFVLTDEMRKQIGQNPYSPSESEE